MNSLDLGKVTDSKVKISLLRELIDSGGGFTFKAEGTSMMPLIPSGAEVRIEKCAAPVAGEIVLYEADCQIRLHRVVSIRKKADGTSVIQIRGDALTTVETVEEKDVIGSLVSAKIDGVERSAANLIPRNTRLFSRWLVVTATAANTVDAIRDALPFEEMPAARKLRRAFEELRERIARALLK